MVAGGDVMLLDVEMAVGRWWCCYVADVEMTVGRWMLCNVV